MNEYSLWSNCNRWERVKGKVARCKVQVRYKGKAQGARRNSKPETRNQKLETRNVPMEMGAILLRIEDLDQYAGPSRGVGLPHNMLDVLFHCLFSNLEGVRNFLICPAFSKMLDN